MFNQSLFKKAQQGDKKAFLHLIEIDKEKLYKMAYLYVKNENDALDIVQETITKAFVNMSTVKKEKYFNTWLTKILINTALDVLRKKSKIILLKEEMVEKQSPDMRIEEKMDLLQAIEQLEEKYKTVIILRYYRDLPVQQIADYLNCPEGTVKSNLHRAIQKLKQFYQGGQVNEQGY
ncbi:TIGR02954 family RNA polymerase sigma-70 factor [Paenisporosarcina sp. HGH0030]|uniref:sigma-70 family RNA polymerase sigma factor n=1 Tax=Paenisporosarcina sp. HGH0030 TaxID=1078085 RepID=UPI00034EAACC|nr:sigma-70 family RNA polymerase sigma factor [Paenisporosarcina sp. HGH0030]EPD53302.1 TIGR02954 family RNA polymerase sigma-70 factor [Paenisporosarcina sp. HGH0030]